jgi:hypothetical protein
MPQISAEYILMKYFFPRDVETFTQKYNSRNDGQFLQIKKKQPGTAAKVKQSLYTPVRALRVPEFVGSQISRQSA